VGGGGDLRPRPRAQTNGSLPDQPLDWLLRTADKFCSPRLRVGTTALAGGGTFVLKDWRGMTFDQIAAELETHRTKLDAARRELTPWRRLLGALNIAPAGGWLQGLFSGASAVKAGAAAMAVVSPPKHETPAPGSPTTPGASPVAQPAAETTTTSAPAAVVVGKGSKPAASKHPKPKPATAGRPVAKPTSGTQRPAGAGTAATPGSTSTPAPTVTAAATPSGISGGTSVTTVATPRPRPPTVSTTLPTPKPKPPVTTAATPTAQTPTVSTPTVQTPTVQTPTVQTPTVPTPTVPTPTVTTPPLP
jgi:hypothetical protein